MLRLALILALLPTLALADITGPARVIDGDTIGVAGQRIRLHGIDALEAAQECQDQAGKPYKCGPRATLVLRRLTDGDVVRAKQQILSFSLLHERVYRAGPTRWTKTLAYLTIY